MKADILRNEERAIFALRQLYSGYGYLPYKMSRFEEYDLYVRNKDFLASQEIITFADRNGRLLALKPDVTLSIIQNTVDRPGQVQKLYYNENVYRVDKGTNTFRESMQAGLECVGDLSAYDIAEVLLLAVKSLEKLGGRFVLDLSHMGLIGAALEESGLDEEGQLEALGFLRQKNIHELSLLCGRQAIEAAQAEKLRRLAECRGGVQVLAEMEKLLTSPRERQALAELKSLLGILSSFGDAVQVDFSVGGDMQYYSGVVFRGYLEGIPVSVLSGGQYDKLLRKMGRSSSAIGFSVNVNLLEQNAKNTDVDTVLLHDGTADPAALAAAAEEAAKEGTVLVAAQLPTDRCWKRVIRFGEEKEC